MTSTSRRRVIIVTALLAAAPALAACGAGPDANTSTPYAPTEANVLIDGNGSSKLYGRNGIKIAQAFLLGPASGAQIAAGGSVPLYLSMVNYGANADTLNGVAVAGQDATSVNVSSAIALPPGKLVSTGRPESQSQIVVQGTKRALYGGESLPLTLKFANAGDIQMTIPVITRSREYAGLAPAPSTVPSSTAAPGVPGSPGTTSSPSPSAAK